VKRFFGFLAYLLLLPAAMMAQDIALLQKEAEKLETTDQLAAFNKYQEILKLQPVNLDALCKSSELCSSIGRAQKDKTAKIAYYKAARHYAEIALRIKPASSESNFVMAMAMGRMAMVLGGRQKIEAVNEIKKYAELAVKYDPANFKAYHVLGKWHYEVSNLNGVERTAARLFYGGLPPASVKEAIRNYEMSRQLNPAFILNYLELAKAYRRNNQEQKAVELLRQMMAMPAKAAEDNRVKEEGRNLLKDLEK
jgi:hypothetical protein